MQRCSEITYLICNRESPRWLIAHDRLEEATNIFAKYHADGDENAPIVKLQVAEIIEQMNLYRDENPWWDFRELYNTKAARYRLAMVIGMAFYGQWSVGRQIQTFASCVVLTFHRETMSSRTLCRRCSNKRASQTHQHSSS
jgi:hypothetical protein